MTEGLSRNITAGSVPNAGRGDAGDDKALRQVTSQMEALFLAEMLKATGFGDAPETLGGGAGEAQFESLLREAQATQMVKTGGIGLAESLFNALKERSDDT